MDIELVSTGLIRLRTGISEKGLPGLDSAAKEQQERAEGCVGRSHGNQLFLQRQRDKDTA